MTATATFHFASQASGLKYLIAPSASVTATGDSLTGIGSSSWAIVGTANSVPADWVLSSAGLHSVVVTAPAGTNKAAILQRTVTSGRDTLVTTAKLYSGTEAPCTNETFESDSAKGWGPLVGAGGASGVEAATASTVVLRDSSARAHVAGVVSDQTTLVAQPADRSTAGVGYAATFSAGKGNSGNIGGLTTVGADNGATPGTNLAGGVTAQVGAAVSNVTAKFAVDAAGTELLKVFQSAADTTRIEKTTGNLEIKGFSDFALKCDVAINLNPTGALYLNSPNAVNVIGSSSWVENPGFTTVLTKTMASSYVENFASGVSCDRQVNGSSRVKVDGTGIGFLGATPVARPTVTGSRGGNAALASLLTALATLGLITDSSSA